MTSLIKVILKCVRHSIAVKARQVGGGYGCKNTKSAHVAAAAAVAALATQKPVRVVLPLETNMRMIGKRPDTLTRYAVKVTPAGDIISLNGSIVEDTGSVSNEPELLIAGGIIQRLVFERYEGMFRYSYDLVSVAIGSQS